MFKFLLFLSVVALAAANPRGNPRSYFATYNVGLLMRGGVTQKTIYIPYPLMAVDFNTALSTCRSRGLDLVTFASAAEQTAIFRYVQDTTMPSGVMSSSFWTGAVRFNSQSYFWLTHQGPTNFLLFNPSMPSSGECTVMEPSGMDRGVFLRATACTSGNQAMVMCEGFN